MYTAAAVKAVTTYYGSVNQITAKVKEHVLPGFRSRAMRLLLVQSVIFYVLARGPCEEDVAGTCQEMGMYLPATAAAPPKLLAPKMLECFEVLRVLRFILTNKSAVHLHESANPATQGSALEPGRCLRHPQPGRSFVTALKYTESV